MIKNEKRSGIVTRRDFLRGTAYGTMGLALGLKGFKDIASGKDASGLFNGKNALSKVVLVRNEAAVEKRHNVNSKIVAEMIDSALKIVADEKDILKAWGRYINEDDIVGVKFSRCSWMRIPTEQAVIDAIVQRIRDLGVSKRRIYAKDYDMPFKKCTALINVPSVKVHALTGIAASIKNYINFTGKESTYHFNGSSKLGEVWNWPSIKGKTRLIIADALRPYFGPGPQINPMHRWDYNGILVGIDPVAVDTVLLRICQEKRNLFKGEVWPITPPARSVVEADTQYRLGTSNPSKIRLIRVGWRKDILV